MDNSILFTALSEQTRRDIVEMLAQEGELTASDISGRFTVSAPAISQHLKVLRDAELVVVKKQAQKRIYRLNPAQFRVLHAWVEQMTTVWEQRFEKLDVVLQQLQIHKNKNE